MDAVIGPGAQVQMFSDPHLAYKDTIVMDVVREGPPASIAHSPKIEHTQSQLPPRLEEIEEVDLIMDRHIGQHGDTRGFGARLRLL